MPETYQSYNAFVSSPSDVSAERQFAEEVITRINRSCLETLRVSLNLKKWEHLTRKLLICRKNRSKTGLTWRWRNRTSSF